MTIYESPSMGSSIFTITQLLEGEAKMYDMLLFLHFTGLALSVGTGFALIALGIGTRDMAPPERVSYMLRAFILSRNGAIGLVLLILSGLVMVIAKGGFSVVTAQAGWPFKVKMVLVLVFLGLFGYMESLLKKAKREKGGPVMAKIPKLRQILLLCILAIVACAIFSFH